MSFVDDDWMERWRRIVPFGPWSMPIFQEWLRHMENEFRELDEELARSMPSEFMREMSAPSGRREAGSIFFHGYSITVGSEGKPKIREFGNVRSRGSRVSSSRAFPEGESRSSTWSTLRRRSG